ncbi:MAG: alpha/beta fold hydrolase, partial [Pseudonocardia sp.]|nr:alpha/beta fold hydrolase [Pseudonocardia sp.]
MTTAPEDVPSEVAEAAARILAPEIGLLADVDEALLGRALLAVAAGGAPPTTTVGGLVAEAAGQAGRITSATVGRLLGRDAPAPIEVDPKDRRFADPTWQDNPLFFGLRQSYLAAAKLLARAVDEAGTDPVTTEKARLAAGFLVDALAPTNFAATNPAVLKRAFETNGASLLAGLRNFADDLLHNQGRPRQVDRAPFRVGENLATTPAKVVYRSDLVEILQYLPQTETVHAVPILMSPPWINKYYVMDLAPERSFIEWAVRRGHTVFAISYRNPDKTMSAVTMDDYLVDGPRTALDVISEITGAPKVDIVGLCLGGALTTMTAAYLAATGDERVNTITLLNTLLDYSEPGVLGVFTDEATVVKLERKLAKSGVLDGAAMAGTFDVLRANDLIFNYVVSNWLLGKQPPAFDILAWNADSTRMPAAMHSFYLRSCYVENRLVNGTMELAGQRLNLKDVTSELYVVAAINDHIVPWESSYRTTQVMPGEARFVLSSGGHIAGIVNPPNPKAWYLTAGDNPASAT